jgi:hypothetical protein
MWSGGVLAGNGKIYGVPALSRGVLEIDIELRETKLYGAGNNFDDKWNGAAGRFTASRGAWIRCLSSTRR